MKALSMLWGVSVLLLMFGAILASLDDFRLDEYTEDHNVTTSTSTSAQITLSNELYAGKTYGAVVTSNVTDDAPVPTAYNESTRALTVSGLQENTSHRLTVKYNIDGLDDYFVAGIASRSIPILLIMGAVGVIVASVAAATGRFDRE